MFIDLRGEEKREEMKQGTGIYPDDLVSTIA